MSSYVKSLYKEVTSIFYPIFFVIHMSQDKNFFYEKYSCYCRAPQWQSCWLSIKRHIKRLWHLHCVVISFKRISLLIYFFAFYVFLLFWSRSKLKPTCFLSTNDIATSFKVYFVCRAYYNNYISKAAISPMFWLLITRN
jgi:hypothetical protein